MPAIEGKKAPAFSLQASTGKKIALKDYKDKKFVVLYFYPKDSTPGCTVESCDFRDRHPDFKKLGTVVLGVSPDDLKSHAKFIEKQGLNFPLLADAARVLCEPFGVWVPQVFGEHKYVGIARTTFIIRDGLVADVLEDVDVTTHVDHVLRALDAL